MSRFEETSVVNHDGHDCWRTWFLDECGRNELFGIGEKHLSLITADSSQVLLCGSPRPYS